VLGAGRRHAKGPELELRTSSRIASASSELAAFIQLALAPWGGTSLSSTRPECSSGTENVNRHAEDEKPRAAVFRYVPHAIPKDEWAPVADFTRESLIRRS